MIKLKDLLYEDTRDEWMDVNTHVRKTINIIKAWHKKYPITRSSPKDDITNSIKILDIKLGAYSGVNIYNPKIPEIKGVYNTLYFSINISLNFLLTDVFPNAAWDILSEKIKPLFDERKKYMIAYDAADDNGKSAMRNNAQYIFATDKENLKTAPIPKGKFDVR